MPPPDDQQPAGAPGFRPPQPLVIGLAGGVASGKSAVAALFAAHGLWHIDADEHARAATADPAILAEVHAQLGERFVVGGQLDRQAVAEHVFSDPEARRTLEQIVHPAVRARILAQLAEAEAASASCLLDVPLLFEAGLSEQCDLIVFVDTPEEVRRARARGRGWAEGELTRREQSQLPLAEKRARSQQVLDNGGALDETRQAVTALLAQLEEAA
jgi:dephospho-CoA kinase